MPIVLGYFIPGCLERFHVLLNGFHLLLRSQTLSFNFGNNEERGTAHVSIAPQTQIDVTFRRSTLEYAFVAVEAFFDKGKHFSERFPGSIKIGVVNLKTLDYSPFSKVRTLGIITMGVTLLLIVSYLYQLILPYSSGTRYVQVDLLDPTLAATQILLVVLVGAWFYVGVQNYRFATRMQERIREIRAGEIELEKRVFG